MNELAQLKLEVEELKRQVKALTSHTTIPFEIDKAFKERLGVNGLQEKLTNSGVAVSTYVQAVDEGGTDTYNVLAEPDYILRMKYQHLTVAVPAYDF